MINFFKNLKDKYRTLEIILPLPENFKNERSEEEIIMDMLINKNRTCYIYEYDIFKNNQYNRISFNVCLTKSNFLILKNDTKLESDSDDYEIINEHEIILKCRLKIGDKLQIRYYVD